MERSTGGCQNGGCMCFLRFSITSGSSRGHLSCSFPFPGRNKQLRWSRFEAEEVAAAFLYLHLSGLATRSTTMARARPSIRAPGIFWPAWFKTIHGAAPGYRRRAAISASQSTTLTLCKGRRRPACAGPATTSPIPLPTTARVVTSSSGASTRSGRRGGPLRT
jgi:hypothetical protein